MCDSITMRYEITLRLNCILFDSIVISQLCFQSLDLITPVLILYNLIPKMKQENFERTRPNAMVANALTPCIAMLHTQEAFVA